MADQQVKEFLDSEAPTEHEGMKIDKERAKQARAAAQRNLFLNRAGRFCEDLVDHFRQKHADSGLTDQEAIFGLALFTINMRDSYGRPQVSDDKEEFDRHAALAEFDHLCMEAQKYWDEHAEEED